MEACPLLADGVVVGGDVVVLAACCILSVGGLGFCGC